MGHLKGDACRDGDTPTEKYFSEGPSSLMLDATQNLHLEKNEKVQADERCHRCLKVIYRKIARKTK